MTWLALIFLVPLIIVPVVLLCGFAGCAQIAGINDSGPPATLPPLPQPPTGLKATANGQSVIDLEWTDVSGGLASFTISRGLSSTGLSKLPGSVSPTPGSSKVTFQDKGLTPGTTFFYKVRATVAGDNSALSNLASATTDAPTPPPPPVWRTAYPAAPLPLNENGGNFANSTVVQRISATLLSPAAAGGAKVRIVVESSAGASLDLLKTTISQAAATGNLFDSAPAPAPFAKVLYNGGSPNVSLMLASQATSDAVNFAFDPTKDLIVAFQIGTNGAGRRRPGVTGARFFSKKNADEAEQADRLPTYQEQADVVYFIQKIEVL